MILLNRPYQLQRVIIEGATSTVDLVGWSYLLVSPPQPSRVKSMCVCVNQPSKALLQWRSLHAVDNRIYLSDQYYSLITCSDILICIYIYIYIHI